MTNLIKVNNGELVVSSREVAENFEKRHSHVVEAIENKIQNLTTEKSEVKISNLFIESEYEHKGNIYKEYLLTRDGFSFIVMGFTGGKADIWKLKYIEAFNKMEQEILQPRKLTAMETLKLQYEVLDEHDKRIENLESNMNLDYSQQLKMQSKAKQVAIKTLQGIESNAYRDKSISSKTFSAIWKDYKDYIGVASYRDTPRIDFEKGINFLENWKPSGKLLKEIEDMNNQINMKEVV